jgi:hypothetical protein
MSSRTRSSKPRGPHVPTNVVQAQTLDATTHWLVEFLLFALIATWSAFYNGIWDCDESMNYFEPLHQVLFGYGLQTWEYR